MNQQNQSEQTVNRLSATYIKSSLTRVVHADGVYGGPTTTNMIYMAFFSEHNKLPDTVQYEIDETGPTWKLKQTTPSPRGNEWIREVEVEILVNLDFARSLVRWLEDKIKTVEKGGQAFKEPGSPQGEQE